MSPEVADLEARVAAFDGAETPERVDALNALAYALRVTESARRLALAEEARTLAGRLGYRPGYAFATAMAGYARSFLSDSLGALPLLLEADRLEALLPPHVAPWVRKGLAMVYTDLGNFEEVLRLSHDLLERARTSGDAALEAWTLAGLAEAANSLDDPRSGLRFAEQALAGFDRLGDAEGRAAARLGVGTALGHLGRAAEARPHLEAALDLARAAGNVFTEARALHGLAVLCVAEGRPKDALLLHRVALELRRSSANRQDECVSLLEIGKTLRAIGRPREAIETMDEALALAETLGAKLRVSQAHLALADTYEVLGRNGQALRHLRRYQAAREEVLGQETAARLESLTAKHAADRARHDAELARRHAEELGRKNDELEALLDELRRTQAQLVQAEKLAGLGRLTAGLAHELRNPLNFVTNFAALSTELTGELREDVAAAFPDGLPEDLAADFETLAHNLARVAEHGRRADAIVRAMMDHARAKPGARRPADLHALLRQVVEGTLQSRPSGSAAVTFDLDPEVAAVVVAPEAFSRCVRNLVENALDAVAARAAAEGDGYRPAVTLRTRRADGVVELRVEDNGPGMPEDVRARAFEPFFTTKAPGEGLGLGLSLAWDIVVHGHGGTLTAAEADGGGAAFVVQIPVDG